MSQQQFQAEVMDELRQQYEAEKELFEHPEPHKRPDYAERMADLADMERKRIREESL